MATKAMALFGVLWPPMGVDLAVTHFTLCAVHVNLIFAVFCESLAQTNILTVCLSLLVFPRALDRM